MYGTLAIVPTLLTTVGQAYRPWVAGKGGRSRGWPRKPSSESSSAVSSPQMYAQEVGAEIPRLVRLVDRVPQPPGRVHRLPADVDVRAVRPDRVRGDDHALDQRVRVVRHQRQVFARAGLALVGVDDEVVRLGGGVAGLGLRDEAPLHAGREAGAAPAAQAGVLDELDQLVRLDGERLAQRGIAVEPLVDVHPPGVGREPALGEDRGELGERLPPRLAAHFASSLSCS
jgi:hypothetical protein